MDLLSYLNELNNSFTTILNTLPFFHRHPVSWFVGICITLIPLGGGPTCLTLGGVGMYEYYKSVGMEL